MNCLTQLFPENNIYVLTVPEIVKDNTMKFRTVSLLLDDAWYDQQSYFKDLSHAFTP